jgi:hypothetical protein
MKEFLLEVTLLTLGFTGLIEVFRGFPHTFTEVLFMWVMSFVICILIIMVLTILAPKLYKHLVD